MNASQIVRATSPMLSYQPRTDSQNSTEGWISANCASPPSGNRPPAFCNFPGFNDTNYGAFYYTGAQSSTPLVTFGPFLGNRLEILADLSGCPGGMLDLIIQPWNYSVSPSLENAPFLMQIPDNLCDSVYCIVDIYLTGSNGSKCGMAAFGGISATFDFANTSVPICDQMISFEPNPTAWNPAPQSNDSRLCSGQSGNTTHVTETSGASASLEFNGTAIAVSGSVENTHYNITLDGRPIFTLPHPSFPNMLSGSSGTLFFTSGLNTSTHTLNITMFQIGTIAGILTLDSVQIFGNFGNSSSHGSDGPTSATSPTSSNSHISPGIIAGAIVGAVIIVVAAAIISYLVIRQRRRRRESIKVSAVQDRFELSPPSPYFLRKSEWQKEEKGGDLVLLSPDVESPASSGSQGLHSEEREFEVGSANGHTSIASFGRSTLIGSEISEDHTRARVHALERAYLSLTASLGMTSNSSHAPPPSYASESDG